MDTQNNASNVEQVVPQNENKVPENAKGGKMLFVILSYLGPLVVVSFLIKKEDPFIKFHIKQGLVLLSIEIILCILGSMLMMESLWPLYKIINLALFVLIVIGIVNVVQDKQKELPFVGKFSEYFPV